MHERELALERLGGLGLAIESQVGATLLGTIGADALDALRNDHAVLQVEVSTRLRLHPSTTPG
jgi:hypothetical protein